MSLRVGALSFVRTRAGVADFSNLIHAQTPSSASMDTKMALRSRSFRPWSTEPYSNVARRLSGFHATGSSRGREAGDEDMTACDWSLCGCRCRNTLVYRMRDQFRFDVLNKRKFAARYELRGRLLCIVKEIGQSKLDFNMISYFGGFC